MNTVCPFCQDKITELSSLRGQLAVARALCDAKDQHIAELMGELEGWHEWNEKRVNRHGIIRKIMKIPKVWTRFDDVFCCAYFVFLFACLIGLLGVAGYAMFRLFTS